MVSPLDTGSRSTFFHLILLFLFGISGLDMVYWTSSYLHSGEVNKGF